MEEILVGELLVMLHAPLQFPLILLEFHQLYRYMTAMITRSIFHVVIKTKTEKKTTKKVWAILSAEYPVDTPQETGGPPVSSLPDVFLFQ